MFAPKYPYKKIAKFQSFPSNFFKFESKELVCHIFKKVKSQFVKKIKNPIFTKGILLAVKWNSPSNFRSSQWSYAAGVASSLNRLPTSQITDSMNFAPFGGPFSSVAQFVAKEETASPPSTFTAAPSAASPAEVGGNIRYQPHFVNHQPITVPITNKYQTVGQQTQTLPMLNNNNHFSQVRNIYNFTQIITPYKIKSKKSTQFF